MLYTKNNFHTRRYAEVYVHDTISVVCIQKTWHYKSSACIIVCGVQLCIVQLVAYTYMYNVLLPFLFHIAQ